MQSVFVFVTEIHGDKTKTGKDYTYFYDQSKTRWNLFNGEKIELNKGYVLDFEQEGQYQNIKALKPVINVFKQEALKEVASKNDIKKDLTVSLSYAKDLVIADKIDITLIGQKALEFYRFISEETDRLYNATQTPKQDIK